MTYQQQQFQSNSVRTRYTVIGAGKPLLFLHGGGVNALTYQHLYQPLSKQYQVIAPDIPGFGKSTTPSKTWNFQHYANFFQHFINHLQLEDVTLVGHSFGGGISLSLAVMSQKVSKLVLIDSAGLTPNCTRLTFCRRLIKKTYTGFLINKSVSMDILKDFFKDSIRHWTSMSKVVATVSNSLYHQTVTFESISQPTYIFWGNADEVFPKRMAQTLNQLIKNSQLTYVAGNHDWLFFMPQKFSELMSATESNTHS